jgi:hypothetical protein
MYHRYTISELSHAIGRQNDIDPSEVTKDFVIRWIGNIDGICLRPDGKSEELSEFSLVGTTPLVEDIDGRGMPKYMDYGQNRNSILNRLCTCGTRAENAFWVKKHREFINPDKFDGFYEWFSNFVREGGLSEEQEDLLLRVTVKASLAFRYCLTVWGGLPPPLLSDIKHLLRIKPKRGQKKGEEPQKPKSHAAFVTLLQAGLYEVQVDGAPTAARLIQEIFEFDSDVKSIASDIRNHHNELLAKQQNRI